MTRYYYHTWTEEEDAILSEIMRSGSIKRKKTFELFEEASLKLERTLKSCENRWYKLSKELKAV